MNYKIYYILNKDRKYYLKYFQGFRHFLKQTVFNCQKYSFKKPFVSLLITSIHLYLNM